MIKTQIMLPDHVYKQAKALADAHEMPMAELIRRGLDYMIRTYSAPGNGEWRFPDPVDLGRPLAPVEDWRMLAHERPSDDHA